MPMSAPPAASTTTWKVLVADAMSEAGIDVLRSSPGFEVAVRTGMKPSEVAEAVGGYDALIVRSGTQVTADVLAAPGRLKVIGRAGTGVDNIDLEAATRAGIVVLNTPGGNSVAAAEQTIALLLALARHLVAAGIDLRQGRWERKKYTGVEVSGKVLGIIGLGRIGREVARRAQGLRMHVIGHDPGLTDSTISELSVEPASFDHVLSEADFLTLHVPKSPGAAPLIGAVELRRMKPGARLINCARGGLVDEAALLDALEEGRLAGAALDVFQEEPPSDFRLAAHPKVVATPHLGASTVEAQERVGTEISEKIRDFLQHGVILDAVNFPPVGRDEGETLQPAMHLAERLGRFAAQVVDGPVTRLEVWTLGGLTRTSLKPIVMSAAKGLLSPFLSGGVSHVNALPLCAERGITVDEGRSSESGPFSNLVRVAVTTQRERATVAGTVGTAGEPRLVEIDGLAIDASPTGHLLLFRNQDVPGVVGRVGTLLGQARVNIAGVQLGRLKPGGDAIFLVSVDDAVPAETLDQLRAVPGILRVRALLV